MRASRKGRFDDLRDRADEKPLESLGNMAEAKGAEGEAAMELIARTRMVAMFANQFPLFRLARTKDPESLLRGLPFLRGDFERLFAKRPESGPKLAVVVFSDPNDLLSFPIPDDWQTGLLSQFRPYARFINVVVNNNLSLPGNRRVSRICTHGLLDKRLDSRSARRWISATEAVAGGRKNECARCVRVPAGLLCPETGRAGETFIGPFGITASRHACSQSWNGPFATRDIRSTAAPAREPSPSERRST